MVQHLKDAGEERMNTIATQPEAILEPELPIIDPHHHLWDWPAALLANIPTPHHGFSTVILRAMRFLLPELLNDTNSGHNIRATVFMECGSMYRADAADAFKSIGETEFVNGIAAMSARGIYGPARICAGIVGFADLLLGAEVDAVLEAHLRIAGDRFKGVRHSAVWDADKSIKPLPWEFPQGLLLDAKFRAGFARLSRYGLSFDSWNYHTQIPELADLARAFPETTIVLDHIGAPLGVGVYAGRRDEVFTHWQRSIRELAKCPNACVKLGGMGMYVFGFGFDKRPAPPSSADLAGAWRPFFETCVEAFGPQRTMFESNFPVDKRYCSYGLLWNAFKLLAAGYSADEKAELFFNAARRVYRLPTSA
jgi:L-fuconolactonase